MPCEIVRNLGEKEYRARPEISQSVAKKLLLPTPAHAFYELHNRREVVEFDMGHAIHSILLEGITIHAVEPEADGRTKAGKEIKAAFAAENVGKIILTKKEGEAVEGMVAGIRRNSGIMQLLESATDHEVSIFWSGMKARLDGVCPLGILDLKSTKSCEPFQFAKSILDYGYHIQAAHYLEAAAQADLPCDNFYFLAVENTAPYEAALYVLEQDSLEIGRLELEMLRTKYFHFQKSGVWPGYSQEIVSIGLPAWKKSKFKEEF